MTVKQKKRAQRQVKQAVRKLDPQEVKEVLNMASPETLASIPNIPVRVPGSKVAGTKVGYTHQDLCRVYGIAEFTPEETKSVTLQGISYQLISGVSMAVPKEVIRIYERSRRITREAANNMPRDQGFETITQLGAGALPQE